MQNELSFLIKLQDMDIAIDELKSQAEDVAPLIQSKNQSLESLKTGLKTAKEKLTANQLKKKQLEGDVEAQEKLVQKHNSELNSLKSNDAYKAMLGEIQAAKEKATKIEDEILVVMELMDAAEKESKELDKKFKSDEGVVRAEIQQLEAKKNEIIAQATAKKNERDEFSKTVPPALLSQYETIREQRGGVAIAPLLNNKSCGGCRMGLTPAKVNEVVKAKAMVLCDTCTRILYNPPSSDSAAAPASNPPQATPVS